MDETTATNKAEILCKVCGDKASGKHYGVASCDGCRGFFKRSIRRNLEYVCKESGRCTVDVTRRNQCQACRFRKCLQVNMKRDAVQHERAPRTAQPSIHHYSLSLNTRFGGFQSSPLFPGLSHLHASHTALESSIMNHGLHNHPYLPHGFLYPGMFGGVSKPVMNSGRSLYLPKSSNYVPNSMYNVNPRSTMNIKDDEVSSSEEAQSKNNDDDSEEHHRKEDAKSRLELPIISDPIRTGRSLEIPNLPLFPVENIYESAAKLLFLSIKWARSIPSFLQLSYRDQSLLLEESWSELFILMAAQWSLPIDEGFLLSNVVTPPTRQSTLEEDARKLRDVIAKLTSLRVDHTEHACLKALVLFKSGTRGLCEAAHIELLQDQTHVMLHEYCNQKQNIHKGRFGKLLLSLPAIQSVSRRGLEELLFRQTVGEVAIDRLLEDLVKATES